MVRVPSAAKKKAQQTKEQKSQARLRRKELWRSINAERENYNGAIVRLAQGHAKSRPWVAMQLYSGGKLLAAACRKNLYNTVLHDRALKRKEQDNKGLTGSGREALISLSQEVSMSNWKNLPKDEEEHVLAQLESSRQEKAAIKKMPMKKVAYDIEKTMSRIDPERTGCQYLSFVMRSDVTDNWTTRTSTTSKVTEACMQLFKNTPEEMAMKIEAYLTTGLAGVIKGQAIDYPQERSSRCDHKGLSTEHNADDILLSKGSINKDDLPSMAWAHYEKLVCTYGVELRGWTEPGPVCNPGDFKTIHQLEHLHAALQGDEPICHWVELDDTTWEARKKARRISILNGTAKQHKSRGGITKSGRGKGPCSAETIDDEDGGEEMPASMPENVEGSAGRSGVTN
ncbi:hypothetical protein BKA93DRAFT_746779 [Sparassis latifolia]